MRVVSNGAIEQASTDSEGMRFSASLHLLATARGGKAARHRMPLQSLFAGEEPGSSAIEGRRAETHRKDVFA